MGQPLRILVVATKPPQPPADGGRLLVQSTIDGLAARGHHVHLVAPAAQATPAAVMAGPVSASLVPSRPRSYALSVVRSLLLSRPISIDRHRHPAVRAEVDRLLGSELWDVVHVEQLQALAQVESAFAHGVPVVLRAQNVESELWAAAASRGRWSRLYRWEAGRLAAWEGGAVARVAATVALTERDARGLSQLAAGRGRVVVVRAPFTPDLPAANEGLTGAPPLVLLGSEGWEPNRDAVAYFVREIWPRVRARVPTALLHVFGNQQQAPAGDGIVAHASPADSRTAFAPGSILVVPLRIASGVRMRILEAWSRGVPVVASPQAAAGLDAEDGRELLVAADGPGFAAAVERLTREASLCAGLVAAGRAALATWHAPDVVLENLETVYAGLLGAPPELGPAVNAR